MYDVLMKCFTEDSHAIENYKELRRKKGEKYVIKILVVFLV